MKQAMKRTILIATFNARTLSSNNKLIKLKDQLKNTKWDIIELREIRRMEENVIKLKLRHVLYYKGDKQLKINGVRFLLNKKLSDRVNQFVGVTDRISLNLIEDETLKVVQLYAPTPHYEDEDVKRFYE